jgi:type 1 glutamine amidotransferase
MRTKIFMMGFLLATAVVAQNTKDVPAAKPAEAKAVISKPPRHVPQPIKPEHLTQMSELIDTMKLTKPATPKRALVFWRCDGFPHKEAIDYANAMFELLSKKGFVTADYTADYTALKSEALAKYDVLVMSNTTDIDTMRHPFIEEGILSFVKHGGGYMLLHGAADNFKNNPRLIELAGTLFGGHPWSGGPFQFKVDNPASPINASFTNTTFKAMDEIYQGKPPYGTRDGKNVLVSLDFSDAKTANAGKDKQSYPQTNDYPVSWTRTEGKGRIFYSSFGHDRRAFLDAIRLEHFIRGYQYVSGELN